MANRFRTVQKLIRSKQKPYNAHKKEIEQTTSVEDRHSAQNDGDESTLRESKASEDATHKHS